MMDPTQVSPGGTSAAPGAGGGREGRLALGLACDPRAARVLPHLGGSRPAPGDLGRAEEALVQCLERDPDDAGALARLACVAFARQDLALAEGYLARYLERHPDDRCFRFTLANLQLMAGRLRAAARTVARLLGEEPDDAAAGELSRQIALGRAQEGDEGPDEQLVLAVIPARGGSKGIPRKNLRAVLGKPLLAYTVEAARAARLVDVVAVSTEDPQIAFVARRAGAEVVDRPPELATDEAPTEPALLHAVREIERRQGRPADIVLLLQATSPLRTASSIDTAVRMLVATGCDSVVAVTEDRTAHFVGRIEQGRFIPPYDPRQRRRRQDLPALYRETGALYAVRRDTLFALECRMGGDMRPLVLGEEESIDIDSPGDLARVEAILQRREHAGNVCTDLQGPGS
jgi:CMP-N,N'-diacetyllegionaminic acid synthase